MADSRLATMTVPGGAVVPLVEPPRRDGPADAPAVVVVVEPSTPTGVAGHHDDPLDTEPFVGQARAQALQIVVRRPDVKIGGERYSLPWDDAPALREFVTTLYLVHGWTGVHGVRDQLQRMADFKLHPGRPAPAGLGSATRDLLAGATLKQVQGWTFAYQDASRLLAGAVLEVAARVEETATTIVQAMLADSQRRVVDETVALFRWKNRTAAEAVLQGLRSPDLEPGSGLDDLRTRMSRLRPAASALLQARRAAGEEARRQRQLLGREGVGILGPALERKLAELREAGTKREAEFSAALLEQAPPRPVLFRLDLSVLTAERQGGLAEDV